MEKQLFYVAVSPESIPIINSIPTYYDANSFSIKSGLTDCTENTLNFLNVLSDERANTLSVLQKCTLTGTSILGVTSLLQQKYPQFTFNSQNETLNYLSDNLPPNSATIGMIYSKMPKSMGHTIIFVKSIENILYLVDKQQNMKFGCNNIKIYLNKTNLDETKIALFFAKKNTQSQPESSILNKRGFSDVYSAVRKLDDDYNKKTKMGGRRRKRTYRKKRKNKSSKRKKRNTYKRKYK